MGILRGLRKRRPRMPRAKPTCEVDRYLHGDLYRGQGPISRWNVAVQGPGGGGPYVPDYLRVG